MKFKIGEEVQYINNPSKIGKIDEIGISYAEKQYYYVFWSGDERTIHCEDELEKLYNIRNPKESFINQRFGGYREFQKLLTYERLDKQQPLRNNIYAYNASRTKFYPFQFKPLIKFLDSPKDRILICDEVGLGKTIEAGIILTELRARSNMQKVLVICPAVLKDKWKIELKDRFEEDFDQLNKSTFLTYLEELKKYPNQKLNGIISLESIRDVDIISFVKETMTDFDLVIVDEAHKMRNRDTKQWDIGKTISNLSQSMLMLTATPVQMGEKDLYHLLNILDDDDFGDYFSVRERFEQNVPVVKAQMNLASYPANYKIAFNELSNIKNYSYIRENPLYEKVLERLRVLSEKKEKEKDIEALISLQRDLSELNLISHIYTRTTKREVVERVIRKATTHKVEFTDKEKDFYQAVTNFVKSSTVIENKGFEKWILHMPQRRMSSSIPVMVKHYKEKFSNQSTHTDNDRDNDRPEALSEEFEEDKIKSYKALKKILVKWKEENKDSKYEKFLDILKKEKKGIRSLKIIVYAFFKGTLKYLEERLKEDGIQCRRIDGSVKPKLRTELIEEFRKNNKIEVLLSSIVGGEGLDFQFCNTILNYDIPWNPMEMEQRIGRIERLGQESNKIFIHNLVVTDTIEERMLDRLYDRIEIFKHAIGHLEPILGQIAHDFNKLIFSQDLTPEEEQEKLDLWEKATKRKIKEFEIIESKSAQFIGTDKFFEMEIDQIRKQKRYVTGEQLRIFILDFIQNYCPKTRIEYDWKKNVGFIYPDEKLKKLIKLEERSIELHKFVTSSTKRVMITFNSDIAFKDHSIEFINILHPLVEIIQNQYKKKKTTFPRANYFYLKDKNIKPGFYIFAVYRLNIRGAKTLSSLETIVVNTDLQEVTSRFKAEVLLGDMIENGIEPDEALNDIDREWLEKAYNTCELIFMDRAEKILAENIQRNENFVNIRLRSLELTYKKNKNWLEEQIRNSDKEFRLNMMKAQLENKTNIYEEKKMKLEGQRKIFRDYEPITMGIIKIE